MGTSNQLTSRQQSPHFDHLEPPTPRGLLHNSSTRPPPPPILSNGSRIAISSSIITKIGEEVLQGALYEIQTGHHPTRPPTPALTSTKVRARRPPATSISTAAPAAISSPIELKLRVDTHQGHHQLLITRPNRYSNLQPRVDVDKASSSTTSGSNNFNRPLQLNNGPWNIQNRHRHSSIRPQHHPVDKHSLRTRATASEASKRSGSKILGGSFPVSKRLDLGPPSKRSEGLLHLLYHLGSSPRLRLNSLPPWTPSIRRSVPMQPQKTGKITSISHNF